MNVEKMSQQHFNTGSGTCLDLFVLSGLVKDYIKVSYGGLYIC